MFEKTRLFGLIGYPVSHSFSKNYFTQKFEKEGRTDCRYELFPMENIDELPELLKAQPALEGLNVTIPHKQAVLRWLDETDEEAAAAGAVNTLKIIDGKVKGYNTDVFGFEQSLLEMIGYERPPALVLGTGGASKAVVFVLKKWNIPYLLVSRSAEKADLAYPDVSFEILENHRLVINTTPLGMHPKVETCPILPFGAFTEHHFAFDLVYNPEQTLFLKKAAVNGAKVQNGLRMLHLQAGRAWDIWNR